MVTVWFWVGLRAYFSEIGACPFPPVNDAAIMCCCIPPPTEFNNDDHWGNAYKRNAAMYDAARGGPPAPIPFLKIIPKRTPGTPSPPAEKRRRTETPPRVTPLRPLPQALQRRSTGNGTSGKSARARTDSDTPPRVQAEEDAAAEEEEEDDSGSDSDENTG